MRKFLLSLLAVFMVTLSVRAEATVVLHEGFENDSILCPEGLACDSVLPPGWTDTVMDYRGAKFLWMREKTSSVAPKNPLAKEGEYRAAIRSTKTSQKSRTRLITPVMDCSPSKVWQPRLIFSHAQPMKAQSKNQDSLKVWYRTSPTSDWELLLSYTQNISSWRTDTVDLISPTNTYQLCFEAYVQTGNGVVLDDIKVEATPQCEEVRSLGVVAMANSAAITIGAALSIDHFQVVVTNAPITDPDNVDTATVVYYNPHVPLVDKDSVGIPNLQQQTDYYVYARAYCSDLASHYTAWVDTTFRTSLGFPLTEEFANGIPANWSKKQGKLEDVYSGKALSDYTGTTYGWKKGTNSTTIIGSTHVECYVNTSGPYWLVSPGIDLTSVPNDTTIEMTFDVALTDYETSGSVSSANLNDLQFTVLISRDNGKTWSAGDATVWSTSSLANHPISQMNNKKKHVRINMNDYKGDVVCLAFVGQTSTSTYYFHLDDVSIHEYDAQCGDVQTVTAQPDVNSITATWTILGKENVTVELSTAEDFATDSIVETVSITSGTTRTFTNLRQNTMYYIRVKQDCAGAEWVSTSCRTAVGLPYQNPFTGNAMPKDWTRHTGVSLQDVLNGQGLPAAGTSGWTYSSTLTANFTGMTEGCMYANLSSTNKYWLVSPTIKMNDTSSDPLRLSFLLAASKTYSSATAPDFSDTDDQFAVLISEDAGRTWTQANATIWDCDTLTTNQKLNTFSEVPQRVSVEMTNYRGKAVKIALYSGSTAGSAANYIFVSNLSVSTYDANCGGVRNLGVRTTSVSASATWTAVGNQTVTVQLSETSDFAELTDSLSTSNSTASFSGLQPHTHYYVRVRQTCSTDDVDWVTGSFTTPYGVPFVETFTASGVPTDWMRCIGVVDSVLAGKERLTTTTNSYQRQWTKGSSTLGTMCVQIEAHAGSSAAYDYHCNSWLITPNLDMKGAGQNAQLSFNLAVSGSTSSMTTATTNDKENTFMVLGSTDDGATWFILRAWRNDGSSAERFSDIPNQLTRTIIDLSQYTSGNLRLAFYGGTTTGKSSLYTHINKVQVKAYDANCQGMSSLRVSQLSSDGATIKWVAGGAQSADVIVATDAAFARVVDSMTVSGDAVVTNLNANTQYYVKARQSCDTEGEWMFADFKTFCNAVSPTDFGVEGFDDESKMDCWTLGYKDAGTIPSSNPIGRANITKFGNVLRLSKTIGSTTTSYANRPYAVTPEIDVDSISKYQVTFDACTNDNSAKNIACLYVGIVTSPDDMGSIADIKTLNLSYATDSTKMNTYVVSFAEYDGDMDGNYGRYIVFSAANAPSDTTNHILIDNISISAADGCQQLIETSIDSVMSNTARFTWENVGSTQYEVLVSLNSNRYVDSIPDSTIVFRRMTPINAILIDSLEGNTHYYAYVRSVCVDNNETTYSRWSSAVSFKTLCTFVSAFPWTETFESMTNNTVPDCWDNSASTSTTAGGTNFYYVWGVYTASQNKSLRMYNYMVSSGTALINTPAIVLPASSIYQLTFDYSNRANCGDLLVKISEDFGVTFTEIGSYSATASTDKDNPGEFVSEEINLAAYAGKTVIIQFFANANYGSGAMFVDNVRISEAPSCMKPATVEVTNPTDNSATLAWTAGGQETNFEYVVVVAGDSVDWSTAVQTSGLRDTLRGLNANTAYEVYVRANCDSTDKSEPRMVSFRTACGLTALPFMETFDALTSGIPACWDNSEGTTTTASYKWSYYATGYEGKGLRFNSYVNPNGNTNVLATPLINLNANALLTFMWKNPTGGAGEVLISTDGGTTRDTLLNENDLTGISTWTEKTVNLSAYTGNTVIIYFAGTSNYGTTGAYLDLDNVLVEAINSCSKPITVAASDPTVDGATLTWTADSTVTNFEYVVVRSGATVNWNDSVAINGRTVTLTGLSANTAYDFYVRSVCGATDKSAPRVATFRTACGQTGLPFSENFETFTSGLPTCWEKVGAGTVAVEATSYVYSGTKSLKFSGTTSPNIIAFPEFAAELNTLQLTFYTRPEGTGSSPGSFDVGYIMDLNDTTSFTSIETWSCAAFDNEFLRKFVTFTSAPAGARLAFRHRSNSSIYYWFVDDVLVETIPDCPKPASVTAVSVLQNQATITWNSDNTLFTLQYSTNANFADSLTTTVIDSTNSRILTGLTPKTTYYVRVKSDCGAEGFSEWSDVCSFATTDIPTPVGDNWSDTFEAATCAWELINGSCTNQWVWGTAANNGGTHSLYVSDDNGANNTYTVSSAAMIYAVKLLNFAAGKYEISYDWQANGESSYDYLRVALVPGSVTLSAGTTVPSGFSTTALPAGWIALDGGSKLNLSSDWTNQSAVVTLLTGNYYLVLAWRDDTSSGTNPPAAVDNVTISRIACAYDVDSVKVSGVTTDSAKVKWNAGEATQWQISYSDKSSFENAIDSLVSDTTFHIGGLEAATIYYVKVRAYCGGTNYGAWSEVVSFLTDCKPIALPYTENLDNLDSKALNCWSVIKYSSYPYIGTTTSSAHSGSNYLYFYGGTSSTEQIAILPEMQYPANLLKISFYSRASSTSSSYGNLIVGVMSDPSDKETFVAIAPVPNNTTYTYFETALSNAPATHPYLAFKVGGGTSYNTIYLDDIQVSLAVNVLDGIFGVATDSVTRTTLDLKVITNPDTTVCHNYQYVISTKALSTAALDSVQKTNIGSATRYRVSGLTYDTDYWLYVRTVCDTVYGPWHDVTVRTADYGPDCRRGEDVVLNTEEDGKITSLPWRIYYKSTYSQQIYTADELIAAGQKAGYISKVAFRYAYTAAYTKTVTLYMGTTSAMAFDGTKYLPVTKVMDTTSITFSTAGEWYEMELTTPYYWDGRSNIVVGMLAMGTDYPSSSTTELFYGGATEDVKAIHSYTDSGTPSMSSGYAKNERANVRFTICPSGVPCPVVDSLSATLTGRGTTTATLSWKASTGENLIDYDVYVGTVNPTTLDSVPETYRQVTATTLSLTDLTPETKYYAAVRANCGATDGYSEWETVTFTTYETCPMVENLQITPVGKTEVRASWEFGGPALDTVFNYVLSTTDSIDWNTVVPDTVNALTLNLTGLTPGQTYWLYVAQNCETENSAYDSVTFTMPAGCLKVVNLTAEASFNLVNLTWQRAAFGYETEWEVGVVGGQTQIVSEPEALFYGLQAHTRYTAYVRAICSESEYGDSVTVSFTTADDPEPCVTVTGETESTSSYLPTYAFYNYSLTEQIYTAAEIGQAGDILSLTFTNTGSEKTRDITIYMAHTTKNAFANGSDWVAVSSSNQVYTGEVTFSANDEVTLTLNRPFNYNGRDNLLLVVDDNTGSYSSGMSGATFTASATQSIYVYSDDTDYSPLAPSGSGTASTNKNKVRFCFNYQAGACVGATKVTVSDVTVQSATVSWMPGGHEVEWNTVLSAVALSDSALVAEMDTVQALSQSFTGLSDDTDYHFYIRSSCDSANVSGWQEVVFTTTARCLVPVNLAVDSVTSTSAYLSWGDINEGYDAATYQVAYGLSADFDLTIPATYQVVPTTDTALVLNGLSANTLYSYAIRIVCDATYTSRWSMPVQARTGCGVVTMFPWTEDFEPYSTGTLNIPCWSNTHIEGSGSSRFQISGTTMSGNDTKKLYLPYMAAGNKTQLTLPEMKIDEANEYEFDIDVLRNATSYATEGLRIYISTDDSLANATELAFISRNYSVADSTHGIPAEAEAGWYTYELNIPIADTLQIIIVGESQSGSAIYADNFRVRPHPTCRRPMIVKAEATENAVELMWTGGNDREYRVECDTLSNFSTARTQTVTADTTLRVTGLTPATKYWFRVKGVCGDSAVSDYSAAVSAKTLYVLPFSESFSSYTIPADWSRLKGDVTDSTEVVTSGWSFTSSSSNYFAYSYVSSSSTTNYRYTLVTPSIVMNTTEAGVQLSFDMSLGTSSTGTTAPSAAACAGREFSVVVSTDKGATWTKVQSWVDSNYAAIPVSARNYKIDLTTYAGQTVQVGFYHSVGTSTSTSSSYIRLDNVLINGYNSACAGIDNLTLTNPSTSGTVVAWEYIGQGAQDAVVVVSTKTSPDSTYLWSDTVRNATTVTLPTMPMSSTIHVFVKQICGEGESAWVEASFKTPIGIPYHPVFTSTTFPSDWSRSSKTAADVFAGEAMTSASSGWTVVAGNDYMDGYHFKNNVYGTSKHDWVITPAIDMTPNVGEGVVLSFDLMLCDYSHPGDAPESQASDDLFMVVISDDGGATWKRQNATLWQDVAGADYSYFGLPYDHVATYRIDLSSYTGKVIKIGFYVESTVYDPDNDLHLGNIHVEAVNANMYSDTICEGETYQDHGFTISEDQYHVGTNSFTNYTAATASTPALLDVLTLEVLPITDTTINVTLCEGEAYTYDENIYVEEDYVEAGDQTIPFFLTSVHGCDSIIYLHITGLPASHTTEYGETCSGIPFNWHGQDYYLTGTYHDTLQTISGCDSICTLLLTVEDVISRDTAVTLCYGDQIIINGQVITTSGVYTELIDNPEGCDEEVVWYVTAVGKLESHKRVVACKGETYSDDLIQGLTTEYHGSTTTKSKVSGCDSTVIYDIWFAAAGETLYVSVPKNELPFYVNGLELIAAGTAEGEYTKTVATNCGDVVMVITVGEAVERYTITVKAENGLPYGGGIYVAGEQVEIGVTPLNGYKFDKWNDGNTENPRTITVSADVTYTGTCVEIEEGLEDVIREMGEDEVLKLIENQQLIIIRNGVRYNAQGAVIE